MDLLDRVQFVRLRCYGRGEMYLASSEDRSGAGLLPDRRADASVLWSVRPTTNPDGKAAFLLRSAYGLYLATSDLPVNIRPHDALAAVQRLRDDDSPPPPELRWQVVQKEGGLMIRNGVGRFLRGNGRYLQWRTAVTVTLDNGSSMLLWDMEVVQGPEMVATPRGPRPSQEDLASLQLFVKHQEGYLTTIRSDRADLFDKKEDLRLRMKGQINKMRALISEIEKIEKTVTPKDLSLALHRPLLHLEIANKAYEACDMKRMEYQTRICYLNSQEAKTKKMIERVLRSREAH